MHGGASVGFLAPLPYPTAEQYWKGVLASHRGQGIATRLMQAVEEFASTLPLRLLVLDTLAGSPAESVYRHLGWQKAGEIPEYAASPDGALHPTAYYFKLIGG